MRTSETPVEVSPGISDPSPKSPSQRPLITATLIAVSLACSWFWFNEQATVVEYLWAYDVELWRGMKWWTLFTSIFLHGDWLHLGFNGYWCWHFGRSMERVMPRLHLLFLIIGTAVFGSLAELAMTSQTGIGMSGMIYGLFGFMLVTREHQPAFRKVVDSGTIRLLIGWLILCFGLDALNIMPVANFAHLGGFISGVLVGVASAYNRWRLPARLSLGLLSAAALVSLYWAPWQDNWHYARAASCVEAGDNAGALPHLDRFLERHPEDLWAAHTSATLRIARKDYRRARDILAAATDGALNTNSLAWLLATCPDAIVRDGRRAVELARQACESTDWANPSYLDTLAAAYAESGNFTEAIKWSTKAVSLTSGEERKALEENLRIMKNGQPIREPQ